jgi:hypothetical protein
LTAAAAVTSGCVEAARRRIVLEETAGTCRSPGRRLFTHADAPCGRFFVQNNRAKRTIFEGKQFFSGQKVLFYGILLHIMVRCGRIVWFVLQNRKGRIV